jgi:GNAT superfamily N-acetyltransferase
MPMSVTYTINRPISHLQFIDVLNRSTLGARRPTDDHDCMQGMLDHSNLVVCAWDNDSLIGIARSVTDFHFCCYLSDLAVDRKYQRQGIGIELQKMTLRQLGPNCNIILLAAPAATTYYPHIGYEKHDSCWILQRSATIAANRALNRTP